MGSIFESVYLLKFDDDERSLQSDEIFIWNGGASVSEAAFGSVENVWT